MIKRIIDSDTNTFILFDYSTGEVISQEEITKPKKHRRYSKKSFKDEVHQPMLTLFSVAMSNNEYSMFIKLLDYLSPEGGLNIKMTELARLEDIKISSLKNMITKYRLKELRFMQYLVTNQYPEEYY